MKRIYFAGSVGKNDWRNDLAVEATGRIMSNGYTQYTTHGGGKFIYGGPFAVSDDHGCFHSGNHGFGPTCGCSGSLIEGEGQYATDHCIGDDGEQFFILGRCQYQIEMCDAIIANISKVDCYGTYYELGYAAAIHKPIFLYCPVIIRKELQGDEPGDGSGDELWFVKRAATILDSLEIPKELLTFEARPDYKEYLQSPQWKSLTAKKRKEAGNKCQLCNDGEVTLHVHHRTYENIYKESMEDLIVLCENCHKKFHDKG